MESVAATVQFFRCMIYILRHHHVERFTVSELWGIRCPAQGHFDSMWHRPERWIQGHAATLKYWVFLQPPRCAKFNDEFVSFHIPLGLVFVWHFAKGGQCTEAEVQCLAQGRPDRDGHMVLRGVTTSFQRWYELTRTIMPDLFLSLAMKTHHHHCSEHTHTKKKKRRHHEFLFTRRWQIIGLNPVWASCYFKL